MEGLSGKSTRIRDVVSELRRRFGQTGFSVVDYWPGDSGVIGIARPGEDEPCLCILTAGKEEGRYDVEHGGMVYRDCLIQGLTWAVREELQAEKKSHRVEIKGRKQRKRR